MDIALALDATGQHADLVLANSDLALDATLRTAVIISFLTDRLADPDDVLPDGGSDRRGWWADAYTDPLPDGSADLIGSKLWLYARCTATQQNANAIRDALQASLTWMTATGVAASVSVATRWVSAIGLAVTTTIVQRPNLGRPVTTSFDDLWNASLGTFTPA